MADTTTIVTERVGMVTEHQMNRVLIVLMTPVKIVLVRSVRVYLQSLTGLLTALGVPGVASTVGVTLQFHDFWHLVIACSSLAVVPAFMSALMNTYELFKGWDASHPELRA
jgi:hypothetical protein